MLSNSSWGTPRCAKTSRDMYICPPAIPGAFTQLELPRAPPGASWSDARTPQVAHLDAEKQQLYLKLLLDVCTSHPVSRLSPDTLGRTLISPPRICKFVPRSLPYCTQYCNIVVCKFISSHPSSWQRVFLVFYFGQNWNSQILCVNICALSELKRIFPTVKTRMIEPLFERLQPRF